MWNERKLCQAKKKKVNVFLNFVLRCAVLFDIYGGGVLKWLNGVCTNFSIIKKDVIKTTVSKQHFVDVRYNGRFLYFLRAKPVSTSAENFLFFFFSNNIICSKQLSSFQTMLFHRFLLFYLWKINNLNSNLKTDGISHSEQTFSISFWFVYFLAFVEDSFPRSPNYTIFGM